MHLASSETLAHYPQLPLASKQQEATALWDPRGAILLGNTKEGTLHEEMLQGLTYILQQQLENTPQIPIDVGAH